MKKFILLFAMVCFLTSCNVTESIVFNENGSGQFLITYEMGEAMKVFEQSMGGGKSDSEKEEGGETMDTTMVFADIMETYKDSVAALPEEKRLAMEAVKDMFMNMKMNEDEGVMNFGIGLNFNSIDDLKDINEKIRKAQSLNSQGDQVGSMKENSPLGNFFGSENSKTGYILTENSFARVTQIDIPEGAAEDAMEELFNEEDESNQQFMDYFENAFYNVKLTFPKPVKSIDVEGAEFSKDRKTVTYRINWIEYLKNPLVLDANVKFVDE
ncbi:hypothetical protein H8K90_14150 [Winogradskyella echinorum]|uniref:Lipoprotein n=1 Tax=Winogradskyella echinorum TaxID=538189 RepID=A0ABR6Y5M8_9FLAO|nr:hypothetical protein [Winogradskyella echinorum]MBC3847535.1 hypothetical protein [Winogradskyella echinorum]MBC5751883.1 hypothetical protein [Winogradskyella echinorum]